MRAGAVFLCRRASFWMLSELGKRMMGINRVRGSRHSLGVRRRKRWAQYRGVWLGIVVAFALIACGSELSRSTPTLVGPTPEHGVTLPATSYVSDSAATRSPIPSPQRVQTGTALLPSSAPLDCPIQEASLSVPRIEMDIAVNMPDRLLTVSQTVEVTNHTCDVWNEVVFAVSPAYRPGVFVLRKVSMRVAEGDDVPVSHTLNGTMLHVSLPTRLSPEQRVKISLAYTLHVPDVSFETWLPEGNLGADTRILQVGDWHPTLVPYREGSGWQIWQYHAVGDPTVYEVADYDVWISASPMTVIAAPGTQEMEGSRRHYTLSRARTFAFLASDDYQVVKARAAGVPLLVYYLPENGEEARAVVDAASGAIALFTDLYGPYPSEGLVVAENAYRGSMEYSGLVSLSGWAMATYNGSPESMLVSLTVHEIAHQWWYSAVGNDQVHEPWLDEALAKYSELLYYERYVPEATESWWYNHIDRYHPEGPLDRSIYAFESTVTYIPHIYGQGARFMAELRALVGDQSFFAFLRAYRDYGEGRVVTASDFFAVLRAYTSADLGPIVARYFSTNPLAVPPAHRLDR